MKANRRWALIYPAAILGAAGILALGPACIIDQEDGPSPWHEFDGKEYQVASPESLYGLDRRELPHVRLRLRGVGPSGQGPRFLVGGAWYWTGPDSIGIAILQDVHATTITVAHTVHLAKADIVEAWYTAPVDTLGSWIPPGCSVLEGPALAGSDWSQEATARGQALSRRRAGQ